MRRIGFSVQTKDADNRIHEFYLVTEVEPAEEQAVTHAVCNAFEKDGGMVVWCGSDMCSLHDADDKFRGHLSYCPECGQPRTT